MDTATRWQPRARAESFLRAEREVMPDDSEGDSTDSRNTRQSKYQRTVATTATDSEQPTFRKPSLPASATRTLEHRPSLSTRRRQSTLRENVRVPSRPREFPSPGKRLASTSSGATPTLATLGERNNSSAFLANLQKTTPNDRFTFGNQQHSSSTEETDSPTTPAGRGGGGLDMFVPTMTFDDFQNSITDPNWTSPLLSEFPSHSGGRALPKEYSMNNSGAGGGVDASGRSEGSARFMSRPGLMRKEQQDGVAGNGKDALGRTPSLGGRRVSAMPANAASRSGSGQVAVPNSVSQPNLTVRTRRGSAMPAQSSQPLPGLDTGAGAVTRTPRKSVGPGLLSSAMPVDGGTGAVKPTISRTSSMTGKPNARRTTLGPGLPFAGASAANLGPEKNPSLAPNTQGRANKVKSLLPPARQQRDQNDPDTPSSSGNKRQSGRASGLGARTISPTDARRLKRVSMMQAPPMPTSFGSSKNGPPTPQEEVQHNPWAKPELPKSDWAKPELPGVARASPSFIPRKSSDTPSSSRASPAEFQRGNYGGLPNAFGGGTNVIGSGGGQGMGLSAKSSYASLLSLQSGSGMNGSTSRLPTPKPRNVQSRDTNRWEEGGLVPPVPAIPKAYESPNEVHEVQPFFSGSLKSTDVEPGLGGGMDFSFDDSMLPPPSGLGSGGTPRGSMDESGSQGDTLGHRHKRSTTVATAAPKVRPQPEQAAGRKNKNLQPLRLPPLNLQPINTPTTNKIAGLPRPSQEVDARDGGEGRAYGLSNSNTVHTPEPSNTGRRHATKTPSTPMTASKATFFRRQDEKLEANKLRSSSSHYALRELNLGARSFFDDSDAETMGLPIVNAKQRAAITPFASGSLPKGSGEFARLRGRPSGEYGQDDPYDLGTYESMMLQSSVKNSQRPKTSGAAMTTKLEDVGSMMAESPPTSAHPVLPEAKKEGGLRRKLSLGWRRSSSKAASHSDNNSKASPQQQHAQPAESGEKEKGARLQKRQSDMPPPKLPASASQQWGVEGTVSARPSLEGARRKSGMPPLSQLQQTNGHAEVEPVPNVGAKTRALHSEQPQPVMPPPATRSSSWAASTFGTNSKHEKAAGSIGKPSVVPARHKLTASTISALVKDKDDLTADDEMRRLSQKRKDVDAAARESEALKLRAIARTPVTPEKMLGDRGIALNIFERGEIIEYERDGVYFAGAKGAKKIIGSLSPSPTTSDNKDAAKAGNYGYDDERGDYTIVLGDHLAYRYEVVDLLGKGSFGQVVRCVDHKEGGVVAVKIIRNKKRFHQQALVEVGILEKLGQWDPDGSHATLSITTSFYFRSHLCIVTPCLSINLYEFIRAHNFAGFPLTLIRRFSRQLLACLVLLQTKRIIHCDLKPENILLCEARKADVRVIDFGSSCKEEEKVYTYIQSRFYRSPEVILGSSYSLGIDMWSLGCILAELWTGYPLFPGENEQEQLACIMEIFGPPDKHLVERCTRKKLFFDSVGKPRVTVSSKGRRRRPSSKTLQQALKTEDEAFVDFVARCLRWDPERRMKPSEAVGHPFVTGLGFHQRGGIPEEARRAARVRSSAAVVPTTNGGSPVKRKEGNAFAQSAVTSTPAKERRALPETPQTALRNGTATNGLNASHGSPSKAMPPPHNRRHSTVVTAGAAVAGSKRASNGVVLGHAAGVVNQSQRLGSMPSNGNLAQMAARESMGGASATASAGQGLGRWRS
ncbi:serine/threonine protein kinase, CMGC, dual-specificity [Elasticomyces elasticus]|nr:serine/threonine protein kinase, CMGC, dual-specificity [Elasticomyces elasticus]